MKRSARIRLSIFLLSVLIFTLAAAAAAEDHGAVVDSGVCGSGFTTTRHADEAYYSYSRKPGEYGADELKWTLYEDGLLEISGRGEMVSYEVKHTFADGMFLSMSTAPWVKYADQLKSLRLGDGLLSIGAYAFTGCGGLTGELIIPESVNAIEEGAFDGCSGFEGVLKIPGNAEYILDLAFLNCKSLAGDLVIPDSVVFIGNHAFNNCNFSSVTIPGDVIMRTTPFSGNLNLSEIRLNGRSGNMRSTTAFSIPGIMQRC